MFDGKISFNEISTFDDSDFFLKNTNNPHCPASDTNIDISLLFTSLNNIIDV